MRGLATNAREIEKLVWDCGVRGDKRRTCCARQEVTTSFRFDRDKLTCVRRLKYESEPRAVSVLSALD
jgi:hypothetical protein